MRVLQLGKFYPIKGGVEKVMWDLTLGLARKGVRSEMLCACLGKDLDALSNGSVKECGAQMQNDVGMVLEPVPGAKIYLCKALCFKASTMIAPDMITFLRKLIRKARQDGEPYDIIHVHHPDPMACLSLRMSGYRGKVVLHYHSDILGRKVAYLLYRPLERWLVNRSDVIVGTTPVYVRDSEVLKAVQQKIRVLPIGAEDFSLRPGGQRKYQATKDEIINEQEPQTLSGKRAPVETLSGPRDQRGTKLVFSMGRLVPYKGFCYLIDAAKYLPSDYRIVIGGSGPLKTELQSQIEREGLSDRVTLAGRIEDSELAHWYSSCDLFCLSSTMRTEAFGIVQIEAMSCSAPVVATEIPGSGVSWVNAHGISGLNVHPEDSSALAEAIVKICSDESAHLSFCRGARERYEQLFRPEQMILGCLDIYGELGCR